MNARRIAERFKDHPVIILIGLAASVVTIAGSIAQLLSPGWAIASVILLVGVLAFVVVSPPTVNPGIVASEGIQRIDEPVRSVSADEHEANTKREAVRKYLLHQFGADGRVDYFYQRVRNENHLDGLYREVMESLLADPKWGPTANGVHEWVAIGFETIVDGKPGWKNSGTINQLYRAAHKSLLSEDLMLHNGVQFAEHVASIVARRRSADH